MSEHGFVRAWRSRDKRPHRVCAGWLIIASAHDARRPHKHRVSARFEVVVSQMQWVCGAHTHFPDGPIYQNAGPFEGAAAAPRVIGLLS